MTSSVDFTFATSGLQSMLKFFTGTLDAAYFGSTPFLLGYAYGLPVRAIGIAQRLGTGHAVVTRGQPPTRPRIGTVSGSTGHEIAHVWATRTDREPVFVDLPPNDQVMAFKAGFIDGIACWEPYTTLAVRLGGERVLTGRESGNQLNLVCASSEALRERAPALRALLRTHDQATHKLNDGVSRSELHFLQGVFGDSLSQSECEVILRDGIEWADSAESSPTGRRDEITASLRASRDFLVSAGLISGNLPDLADAVAHLGDEAESEDPDRARTLRLGYSDSIMCAPILLGRHARLFRANGLDDTDSESRIVERIAALDEDYRKALRSIRTLISPEPELAVMKAGKIVEQELADFYERCFDRTPPRAISGAIDELSRFGVMPTRAAAAAHWLRNLRNDSAHRGREAVQYAETAYRLTVEILEWLQQETAQQLPRCARCGRAIEDDSWVACPHCAQVRRRDCGACGEPVQASWKACPHCGHGVQGQR
ncbi:DUF4145 domain-containing protein [Streptomyces meridianus]|uniref:DUF4145 domain-containing protein n=1 Tax=Streptomyces meridianus TaxID=2938945 RepID=A0ABT0X709_9ACTN|nr:DUF4145 domain-containing protein [Streptomyces meridianus]MCM2577564.1 hypothetical protein [Streptomyces meridianus]